jgi:dTDP-4-amino-4,6-dideoxygalactose transaminase
LAHQAKSFPLEYIHDFVGYNYGMPNLSAALGLGQLARLDEFLESKRKIHQRYLEAFEGMEGLQMISKLGEGHEPGYWLNTVFTEMARPLEAYLEMLEIQSRKLWVPMNRLPMYGDKLYFQQNDHSHSWYERSLCLPSSTSLTVQDQDVVIAAVKEFFMS